MNENILFEESSGNIYADLDIKDADEMLRKAKLVANIQDTIKKRGWTQQEAAKILGMTQPKLSLMLRGQFHGISETKILDCLARLGNDIQIVVTPRSGTHSQQGGIQVVFV